jgi:hypothetical protein
MPHHIFFSWQSDLPNRDGRSFIEGCLKRAIGIVQADAEIDPADREMAVDRDTLDVPGSPPIMETIFGKIERASVFLADLTYVAERIGGGGYSPNPNVCIEHGYALKALSWRRVIAVMNTASGHPDQFELPFDVRHTRRPIFFECAEDADADTRAAAKAALTKQLAVALKAVFGDEAARATMQGAAPAQAHPHDVELLERVHRQLPIRLREFLREHSFGAPFLTANLDPLHEMRQHWVGAAFEFHDLSLQGNFANLKRIMGEFSVLVLERTYAMPNSTTMAWPKTDMDVEQGLQPRTEQAISDMNAKATELTDAIDSFDRLARDRVRIATGTHAEAGRPSEPDKRKKAAAAALSELGLDEHHGGFPEIVTRPRLTLRLAPFAALEGRRLDTRVAANAQQLFPPNKQARVKTDSDGQQWWSCAPPQRLREGMNPETTWRMRLVRPGYLEFSETIGRRIEDDPQILIDGRRLEAKIVRHLERMGRIVSSLELGGAGVFSISLDGVEDVELTRARPGGRRIRRSDIVLPTFQAVDFAAPLGDTLREALDMIWQSLGWEDGSPSFDNGTWAGYVDEQIYDPS